MSDRSLDLLALGSKDDADNARKGIARLGLADLIGVDETTRRLVNLENGRYLTGRVQDYGQVVTVLIGAREDLASGDVEGINNHSAPELRREYMLAELARWL